MEAELRRWIAEHGEEGRMPTQRELRASGAAALYDSISRLGGTKAFARRLRRALATPNQGLGPIVVGGVHAYKWVG